MGEIGINYKMVWVKGSMSIGGVQNTLQIVGVGFKPSIGGGVLTTLQLLGERLQQM